MIDYLISLFRKVTHHPKFTSKLLITNSFIKASQAGLIEPDRSGQFANEDL